MSVSFPKPLTEKEEKFYIKQYEQGDLQARHILIERNLRLVAHVAKKYATQPQMLEEYISIGTIGLIKAVNTYRSSRKVKLATYAARCIENEILMSIRASRKFTSEVSLNVPIGTDKDGNEINLNDILGTDPNEIVDSIHEKIRIQHMLLAIHNTLTPREQKVLIHRYGLFRTHPKTQRETAALRDQSFLCFTDRKKGSGKALRRITFRYDLVIVPVQVFDDAPV